jgi:hypothetical protein
MPRGEQPEDGSHRDRFNSKIKKHLIMQGMRALMDGSTTTMLAALCQCTYYKTRSLNVQGICQQRKREPRPSWIDCVIVD